MKKLLEIIGIIIGLGIIIFEGIRLYKGLTYEYTVEDTKKIVDDVRSTVRESDVLNYINSVELNIIGEIDDENIEYNTSDYDKYTSSKTKPVLGYFTVVNGSIDNALLEYSVNNKTYYACYYENGKTEIKQKLSRVTHCNNLIHNFE